MNPMTYNPVPAHIMDQIDKQTVFFRNGFGVRIIPIPSCRTFEVHRLIGSRRGGWQVLLRDRGIRPFGVTWARDRKHLRELCLRMAEIPPAQSYPDGEEAK